MKTFLITIASLMLLSDQSFATFKHELVNGPFLLSRRSAEINASVDMCVTTWKVIDSEEPSAPGYISRMSPPGAMGCPDKFESYEKTPERPSGLGFFEGIKVDSTIPDKQNPVEWTFRNATRSQVLFFKIENSQTGQATWDAVCAPLRLPKEPAKAPNFKEPVLDLCERESPSGIIHDAEKEKNSVKCPFIDKCLGDKRIALKVRTKDGKLVTHVSPGLPRAQGADDHVTNSVVTTDGKKPGVGTGGTNRPVVQAPEK